MSNFIFLKAEWPDLHEAAVKAEALAYSDARSACFYARRTLELAVHWLYKNDSALKLPYQEHLSALIHEPTFRNTVGPTVFAKARVLKEVGNLAVHSHKPVRQLDAITATRELFHFCFWLARSHLHHFLTSDACYADLLHSEDMGFDEERDRDENKATLMQVAPDEDAQFAYEYDFGDSWEHEITVEKILPSDSAAATAALCLDGARACPPDDCGGIWGYANLLKILKNRKHPEYKDMKAWIGGSFDAEAFDSAKINLWPRVTEAQLRKVLMSRDGYKG